MATELKSTFRVQRLGIVMSPDPKNPDEVEGVLNPAIARAPDGQLYMFPRIVGKGNYSRVGIARVLFNDSGDPVGVERMGYALEPSEPYELCDGGGGCEDARVTYVDPIGKYVMAYAALGPDGPRVALAVSDDLFKWERIGLVNFEPNEDQDYGVLFNEYHNKDAAFANTAFMLRNGRDVLAMMHRPLYDCEQRTPKGIADPRPSIWISACDLEAVKRDIRELCTMRWHFMLIDPEHPWEHLRIGGGTPPVWTRLGHMYVYHGVSGEIAKAPGDPHRVNYTAGVLILSNEDGRLMQYRSDVPILIPETAEETTGVVNNVVFPTGIDDRGDGVYDLYYGMADQHIGAVRMWLPDKLTNASPRERTTGLIPVQPGYA